MTKVALLGATGFVGSAVGGALRARGAIVTDIGAPRLGTDARTLAQLEAELGSPQVEAETSRLRELLAGHDVVVNAAGVAAATGGGDHLFGANALLPAVVAAAAPVDARVVHVSSAAVQGRTKVLDETDRVEPFSPYSSSKALGEQAVRSVRADAVVYRPTSVQGAGRPVTQQLTRILRSPIASVASGVRPTPQILVQNVGEAVAFLALTDEQPPAMVLHPWEGVTTRELYELLGGRRPLVVPAPLAAALVAVGFLVGRVSGKVAGLVRRVEMLWFGQQQAESWLDGRWSAPAGRAAWQELSRQ